MSRDPVGTWELRSFLPEDAATGGRRTGRGIVAWRWAT